MPQMAEVMAELTAALDALCASDPAALADGETIEGLQRQLARLDAVATRASAAFDASRAWEADGARTAAAWISTRCHLPKETARRQVYLGRTLRHLPKAEEAWLAGDINEAHASLLARARTPKTEERLAADEEMLCDHAKRLRYHQFARALAYWRYHADAASAEDEAEDQRDGRRLHLSRSFENMYFLDGALDPIAGSAFEKVLKAIEEELFAEEWAEAKARLGDSVRASDLKRTPAQRRADALVEMARRAAATPPGGRLPEPLFTVLVGYETFAGPICELASGTVVTPGSLSPYIDRAWVERVVFDGPSRVIDVGVRRRLFAGATRRGVLVRDRECFHEFCDLPAEDCQVDHIEPFAAGGLTTTANGRPGCDFHNRNRHRRAPPAR
jgi:hypothetical protein